MATSKVHGKQRARTNPSVALAILHREYVTPVPRDSEEYRRQSDGPPNLRKLAKVYGVPYADADRARTLDHWDDERRALDAEDWRRLTHPNAPTDEALFIAYVMAAGTIGAPDPRKAPKQYGVAVACARALWWRTLAHVAKWEAVRAELAARVDYGKAVLSEQKAEV